METKYGNFEGDTSDVFTVIDTMRAKIDELIAENESLRKENSELRVIVNENIEKADEEEAWKLL